MVIFHVESLLLSFVECKWGIGWTYHSYFTFAKLLLSSFDICCCQVSTLHQLIVF